MDSPTQFEKYGFYVYTQGLEKGLGIVIFDITDTDIDCVKYNVGYTERVSLNKSDLQVLLQKGILQFIQIVPKFVRKDLAKAFYKK